MQQLPTIINIKVININYKVFKNISKLMKGNTGPYEKAI